VLGWVSADETILFIGLIGIVFLMFIAGSEIKIKTFKRLEKQIFALAILNGGLPFVTGFGIGWFLTQNIASALIIGIAFISSSVALIIPSLGARKLIHTRLGETIISATVFEDIGSLLLFSFILQSFSPKTSIPLIAYIPLVIGIIFVLKKVIPPIERMYHYGKKGRDLFENELIFVFVSLLATVVLFESIGMHAIVAGFVIGIILSDSIRGKIEEKIRTISYGFFIPIFFLMIGMQMDLSVFISPGPLFAAVVILIGLIGSKVISGFVGGKLLKFNSRESLLIGFTTIPQLSTTLAVAFVALELGLLSQEIITALIILSTVTTFVSPIAIRLIAGEKRAETEKASVLNKENA